MKKKVIYILHDFKNGGVEVALLSALQNLNNEFDFRLIVLGFVDVDFIKFLDKKVKDKIVVFPFKTILFPFYFFNALLYILRFKPDVLVCSLWRSNFIGALSKLLRKDIFFITFIHSTYFHHFFDKIFSLFALRTADKVFVDSLASKKSIENKNSKLDCEIISFVINENQNTLTLPVIENKVSFLFIGRINWVKNLPLAVRFVKELHSRGVDLKFDIYGEDDGDLKNVINEIEKQNAHEIVNLKGGVSPSDKELLFSNYNFYIQLSQFEGMAMSVVEAMQYGLVCLVNPVGEIPNYTTDMQSALDINIHLGAYNDNDLTKVISVINNPKLFNEISNSAFDFFKDKLLYKDSLIDEINKIIRFSNKKMIQKNI
ncbi:glycosyltransferase family 4 protein [Flavobacteriaceae bacterium]|nr:glycosyltransferase family 4 protein [Flavobacteriaceae bacterium]